jgi:RHS repeat-associated protein
MRLYKYLILLLLSCNFISAKAIEVKEKYTINKLTYTKSENNNRSFLVFRQLGMYRDQELGGLCYNRFRYYDANIGGYISEDPIGLHGNNPTLYGYVKDSNNWIDPLGLSSNPSSFVNFTDTSGTSLQVNGYTDLSHMSDADLKSLYHANRNATLGKGFGKSGVDKQGNTIVLHHYKQDANGPIVAMPAKHHDKPHTNPGQHPFGKTKGGGLTQAQRDAFNRWKQEYWMNRAEAEMNKRGKTCR